MFCLFQCRAWMLHHAYCPLSHSSSCCRISLMHTYTSARAASRRCSNLVYLCHAWMLHNSLCLLAHTSSCCNLSRIHTYLQRAASRRYSNFHIAIPRTWTVLNFTIPGSQPRTPFHPGHPHHTHLHPNHPNPPHSDRPTPLSRVFSRNPFYDRSQKIFQLKLGHIWRFGGLFRTFSANLHF